MKKIIAVFDGSRYSDNVMRFIERLNDSHGISVSGIFLNAYDYAHLWSSPVAREVAGAYHAIAEELKQAETLAEEHIERFEKFCMQKGIPFTVHNETSANVFEVLKKETRFADLMILSNDLFYSNIGEQPNEYMKQVLHSCECGVLLLPEQERFPDKLILSYDGSQSSVFAIKQFAYILPELCDTDTILVSAENSDKHIPDQSLIEELAVRHFPKLSMQVLEKEAGKHFAGWLSSMSHPLLVAGAYSRSGVSRLFQKSFISDVISQNKSIIFIAHK